MRSPGLNGGNGYSINGRDLPPLARLPVHCSTVLQRRESATEISFRQIHKPSGRRYEKVVQGIGKIDNADIVKGYEVDKDVYVTLDPEEIDASAGGQEDPGACPLRRRRGCRLPLLRAAITF